MSNKIPTDVQSIELTEFKEDATKLRGVLKEVDVLISHSQALEVLSKFKNYKNWQTAHAILSQKTASPIIAEDVVVNSAQMTPKAIMDNMIIPVHMLEIYNGVLGDRIKKTKSSQELIDIFKIESRKFIEEIENKTAFDLYNHFDTLLTLTTYAKTQGFIAWGNNENHEKNKQDIFFRIGQNYFIGSEMNKIIGIELMNDYFIQRKSMSSFNSTKEKDEDVEKNIKEQVLGKNYRKILIDVLSGTIYFIKINATENHKLIESMPILENRVFPPINMNFRDKIHQQIKEKEEKDNTSIKKLKK